MITEEDIVQTIRDYEASGDFDGVWQQVQQQARPRRRWPNIVLALAAAAVLALALWPLRPKLPLLGSAVPDEEAPAAPDYEESWLEIIESLSLVLTLPRTPTLVGSADPSVVEIEELTERSFRILGLTQGETVVRVAFDDGEQQYYRTTVMPPQESEYDPDNPLQTTPDEPFTITTETSPVAIGLPDPTILTTEIEDDGRTLIFTPIGLGVTDLVLMMDADQPPLVYELSVVEEPP
ncbi:MAG: pilus assembly protein N-terminal domain-containing protein [Myxococcales bacterium]|nr:pilus assembly protein N-terminal domain-containing protein [Myxococcales bacterium]